MINSLSKGKRFEREVAKILTEHFGVPFKRVPMSGAFSTTQNTENPVFRGDVFTEDEGFNRRWNVVIECKRINKLPKHNFDNIIRKQEFMSKSVVNHWLGQCSKEAMPKNFWLIFREDYGEPYIIRGYNLNRWKNPVYSISHPELLLNFLKKTRRKWEI